MSDTGNVNGEVIDSPTPNSFVVGVTIAAGEAAPKAKSGPTGGTKTETPAPAPTPEPASAPASTSEPKAKSKS